MKSLLNFRDLFYLLPPLIASSVWFFTLTVLFILWNKDGRPRYEEDAATIAFISHVGAKYKKIFIIGCSLTAVFFTTTLLQFIVLNRRLKKTSGSSNKIWADLLAFILGTFSSICLILLSIYDSANYDMYHWMLTLCFAFSAVFCAIFNAIGISAGRNSHKFNIISFIFKLIFSILSLGALIAMITLMLTCYSFRPECSGKRDVAAILEWCLGILFFIFISTWVVDFFNIRRIIHIVPAISTT